MQCQIEYLDWQSNASRCENEAYYIIQDAYGTLQVCMIHAYLIQRDGRKLIDDTQRDD
jgi:hypothetical protein